MLGDPTFTVEICPDIPGARSRPHKRDLITLDFHAILSRIPSEYLLSFVVCGKKYCYYPSNILTVYNDIIFELDKAQEVGAHEITMSGYPVGLADVAGDTISFAPFSDSRTPTQKCVCRYTEVISALDCAAADVWEFMTGTHQTKLR